MTNKNTESMDEFTAMEKGDLPTRTEIHNYIAALTRCATEYVSNAQYIQKEIPRVVFPEGYAEKISNLCGRLLIAGIVGSNVCSQLEDTPMVPSLISDLKRSVENANHCFNLSIGDMHEIVTGLEKASKEDRRFSLGFLLVMESATNILLAINEVPLLFTKDSQ